MVHVQLHMNPWMRRSQLSGANVFGKARHAQGAIRQNTFLKYRKSSISPVLSFFFKQRNPLNCITQTKLTEFVRPIDRLAGAGTDCYFDQSNTTHSVPHLCESYGGQASPRILLGYAFIMIMRLWVQNYMMQHRKPAPVILPFAPSYCRIGAGEQANVK